MTQSKRRDGYNFLMRKLLLLAVFFLCFQFLGTAKASRPNFVVFQVDDMARSALNAQYRARSGEILPLLPNLQRYFLEEGRGFTDFVASSPLCAPSRASLLSGQYAHTNRVARNGGSLGGALGWKNSAAWSENLLTRLQEVGYETGHFGKWTNHYGEDTDTHIPPGWDTWVTDATDDSTRDFYGYYQRWRIPRLGIDSVRGPIGDPNYAWGGGLDSKKCKIYMAGVDTCRYHSDLMTRMAGDEIRAATNPFYIQIDYHAPHGDKSPPAGPQVASRHLHLPSRVVLPRRPANFNEADTSDKDYLTQEKNGLLRKENIKTINDFNRHALVSLRAVDQGIGYIAQVLQKRDLLKNTYLIFLSDNGFFYGEHRFFLGKISMYDESSRVPFYIRGPGIRPGKSSYPASTIDFAPTLLDIAGGRELPADGESLRPVLQNPSLQKERPRLIEWVSEEELNGSPDWNRPLPQFPLLPDRLASKPPAYSYRALKLGDYKYLSYDRGGEELYNLEVDPREMNSLHRDPAYEETRAYMEDLLARLRNCQGEECFQK